MIARTGPLLRRPVRWSFAMAPRSTERRLRRLSSHVAAAGEGGSHYPTAEKLPNPLPPESTAEYRAMTQATKRDLDLQTAAFSRTVSPDAAAERALTLLMASRGCFIGNHVDMYEHNLQAGTRALRAGEPEETVVVALLHDIGEAITPNCHGEIAAGMLRPYISEQNYWILMHHEVFQARYYGDAAGIEDVDGLITQFRDSPHYDACVHFCQSYDQTSFDPDYDTEPLEVFVPMVRRIFARTPYAHADADLDRLSAAKLALAGAYPNEDAASSNP